MFKKQDNSENTAPTSLRPGAGKSLLPGLVSGAAGTEPSGTAQATIGPGIRINGDIAGNEDLLLHGQVAGSISLPDNTLIIGKQASIDADVSANIVEIEGKVSGTVQAVDIVRVKPCGQIKGDIAAPRVVLEDGCQFRGSIDMQEQKPVAENKSAQTAAKANGASPPAKKQAVAENTTKA